ncbi:hypothetical protein HR45_09435 [Shewanella mangrovi]|uniref:Transcription regulator PadR N-terminal domain-containing protein n=1 Tax=Shewanella mangrovi TaxID=1515746 RepID=A0A094JCI9_9GAMM|nr:PadR family transcriptional regulator [Shewanella mangrovi]KFZ37635.1 hypothetical protein HR45_09435 [Shewanella mangrovi]
MPQQRYFQRGEVKSLVMYLLQQRPAHGHELIKGIANLVGEEHQPSPAEIYPALASLEVAGFICGSGVRMDADGSQQFQLTEAGKQHLLVEAPHIQAVLARLQGTLPEALPSTEVIMLAMTQLQQTLDKAISSTPLNKARIAAVADILQRASLAIEQSQ